MKKEKTIRTYQRRTKTGKVVTVKQHTAKYDAAEALKEAAKKKGAGDELEALKKKKPVVQKEEAKSPYEEYGFTKDEFKEWYEGTGSKADKKVEKALKKAMGTKAYNALSDKAADEYKKGGAHRFFTKGLEEMKASTSASTKSVTPTKETKEDSLKVGSSIQMGNSTSLGKGKKETFKVLAVQKTNKQDRELGNTEAAWIQRKDGSITLALKDSEKGWMYDDTWTDFTDRKHPYAKSLEAAGYSLSKAKGKGGDYWEAKSSKSPKPFKHTDGGTSAEYDAAYAKMNKLISKHGGVPKKDHKDYAAYKEAEKYVNDFKAGKVGGTKKETSAATRKKTAKLAGKIAKSGSTKKKVETSAEKEPSLPKLQRQTHGNVFMDKAFAGSHTASRSSYIKTVRAWAKETDPEKKKRLLKKKNELRKELGYGKRWVAGARKEMPNSNNSGLLSYERKMQKYYSEKK